MTKNMEDVMNKLKEKIESQARADTSQEPSEPPVCDKCQDLLGSIVMHEGVEFWRDCSCVTWRRTEKLMKSSEITAAFQQKGFGSFVTAGKQPVVQDMFDTAKDYYMQFDTIRGDRQNSISLHGNPGTGKTHLLLAVSNNLMKKKGVPVQYFPYVEGFNDLKDDFSKLEQKMDRMKKVDVLFIDDLFKPAKGVPRATDWQVEQMYAVINHRYLNYKPIMVSSELSIDDICDIDEALGTRIFEMAKHYTVLAEGDRRLLNHRLEA